MDILGCTDYPIPNMTSDSTWGELSTGPGRYMKKSCPTISSTVNAATGT